MPGLLRQLFGGTDRPFTPAAVLPTEGWCEVAGIARMDLVWPWYQVPDSGPLVDSQGRQVDVRPILEVRAPRTDEDLTLVVWTSSSDGSAVGSDWGLSVSTMYPGSQLVRNVPLLLNGAMGRLASIVTQEGAVWRIVVPRHEYAVHLEVGAPHSCADAYWAQVETMLATWEWLG